MRFRQRVIPTPKMIDPNYKEGFSDLVGMGFVTLRKIRWCLTDGYSETSSWVTPPCRHVSVRFIDLNIGSFDKTECLEWQFEKRVR